MFILTLIASSFSGFVTGLITTPLDVFKTRYQLNFNDYDNLKIFGGLNKIHKSEGISGLFTGKYK